MNNICMQVDDQHYGIMAWYFLAQAKMQGSTYAWISTWIFFGDVLTYPTRRFCDPWPVYGAMDPGPIKSWPATHTAKDTSTPTHRAILEEKKPAIFVDVKNWPPRCFRGGVCATQRRAEGSSASFAKWTQNQIPQHRLIWPRTKRFGVWVESDPKKQTNQ
jgi:hypothetical protein